MGKPAKPIELLVPRHATAIADDSERDTRWLSDWRHLDAYVLLGDPGAGKTKCFEAEAQACATVPLKSRNLVDGVATPPTAAELPVFIDGLDEVRAGSPDARTPFGVIRKWLFKAGKPRFRISCREADWRGQADEGDLGAVAPNGRITVLHLEPLNDQEQRDVVASRSAEIPDVAAFFALAEQQGLRSLFGNPLLLDLTIKAVARGDMPANPSRKDIYEAACRQMAEESNEEHLAVRPPVHGDIDRLLNDAGLLCAVMLLSNRSELTSLANDSGSAVRLIDLPSELPIVDAKAALASKLFTTVAGHSTPRHRSIAEFLAAKALAKCLDEGLPIGRLLALIQGFDGRPVEPLRGIFAWLLTHRIADRDWLMKCDPLGVVLNGDVAAWSTQDRKALFDALQAALAENRFLLNGVWVTHPFGALAKADMAGTIADLLRDPRRDHAHLSFMGKVFDALSHGEAMPELVPLLEAWVEDSGALPDNRVAAYVAWKRQAGLVPVKAKRWLEHIHAALQIDERGHLASALLRDLYPIHVGPDQILRYMRPLRLNHVFPQYAKFWKDNLLLQSRPNDLAQLADAWAAANPISENGAHDFEARNLGAELLAGALANTDEDIKDGRLFSWLGICIDGNGFSAIENDDARRTIRRWLEARPARMKSIIALEYLSIAKEAQPQPRFWESEHRLHGASQPKDWFNWMLAHAAEAADERIAKYCFQRVVRVATDNPADPELPTPENIVVWVEQHANKWPAGHDWLQEIWYVKLADTWQPEQIQRQRQAEARAKTSREHWRQFFESQLPEIKTGRAQIQALKHIANAYRGNHSDALGDTPLERVLALLVTDTVTAKAAIAGVCKVLLRDDLPSILTIFKSASQGQLSPFSTPALLAAQLQFQQSNKSICDWRDDLAEKLIAFYLASGTGEIPDWYRYLVANRPTLVAPIYVDYCKRQLRDHKHPVMPGPRALSTDEDHRALAQLVVPELLAGFPVRGSEAACLTLNLSLLSALHVLPPTEANRVITAKLADPRLGAMQRICWMVAALPYVQSAAESLTAFVGKSERRALAVGLALEYQGNSLRTDSNLEPAIISQLIETLMSVTPLRSTSAQGKVTIANQRARLVSALLQRLAADASTSASDALSRLKSSNQLGGWRDAVVYSASSQQAVAREAGYRAATPDKVARTIAGGQPANHADLLVLTIDHLRDIVGKLRGSPRSLLWQYFAGEGSSRVPRIENECRDMLMAALNDRLNKFSVQAIPEAIKANDKRADMNIGFMRFGKDISIPVEVKKDSHRQLWTAWRDQLQALYAIDPSAKGYGIYLVLWFGVKTIGGPDGQRPISAQELAEILRMKIPQRDAHQIIVEVLDLSWHADPKKAARAKRTFTTPPHTPPPPCSN